MHWYAFPWTDYKDSRLSSRMQVLYALRDCVGYQDIVFDTKHAFPDICDPCACLSSFLRSRTRRGPVYLSDDNDIVSPLRRDAGYARYGINDPLRSNDSSIAFELNEEEEKEYVIARHLVFGDYNFPVIHESWVNPPDVQSRINENASQFYENLKNSVSKDSLVNPIDLWNDDENDMLIPDPIPSSSNAK